MEGRLTPALPAAQGAWPQEPNSSLYIFPGMRYGVAHTQNLNFSRSDTSKGRPKEAQERFGAHRPTEFLP